jgi:thiamine biosynthesis lipoprotein
MKRIDRWATRALAAGLGSCLLLLVSVAAGASAAAGSSPSGALELEAKAFGQPAEIEIVGLSAKATRAALHKAFDRLHEVEGLIHSDIGKIDRGSELEREVTVSPETAELLERADHFCTWSQGANGPLGGDLAAHWRAVGTNPSAPPPGRALVASAACNHLTVNRKASQVWIAAHSRADVDGFAAGFAVDQAVAALRDAGVTNGRVRVGRIVRAFGPGPTGSEDTRESSGADDDSAGRGWPVSLPVFEGFRRPLDRVVLRDQALAVVWRADWTDGTPRYVDQRTGEPPHGVWATIAVTDLAVDAQALAASAMVLGSREGRFKIAALEPHPSVLWLLGSGKGKPLLTDYNWAALRIP